MDHAYRNFVMNCWQNSKLEGMEKIILDDTHIVVYAKQWGEISSNPGISKKMNWVLINSA